MTSRRWTFTGRILGVGTSSGVRLVVGMWDGSPLGAFADVMVERADGHRLLLAPSHEVADFVTGTYTFDETRVEDVAVTGDRSGGRLRVATPSLTLDATLGPRTALGWLLSGIPGRLAASPLLSTLTDPVARVVLRGVRTRGSAGQGRREYYGATDVRAVTGATARLDGVDLGTLTPVDPPARFGFSSTPRRPSLTEVVTTIRG
ncbi:hypothetical protein [Ornithinimicrobium pekingense]|uniref:Uncharacterized protein n=1 Tax=Ornithinimicrobium pekingense TaxID=384677 RepID=A0ABQ2F8P7_9MICO|nr:hypothetical protein [Ornithinimicrobium pekingense]GGK72643.1 hypothetical protein GCM10011509_21560 [Ornithinimicrobium pekingense]